MRLAPASAAGSWRCSSSSHQAGEAVQMQQHYQSAIVYRNERLLLLAMPLPQPTTALQPGQLLASALDHCSATWPAVGISPAISSTSPSGGSAAWSATQEVKRLCALSGLSPAGCSLCPGGWAAGRHGARQGDCVMSGAHACCKLMQHHLLRCIWTGVDSLDTPQRHYCKGSVKQLPCNRCTSTIQCMWGHGRCGWSSRARHCAVQLAH